MGNRPSARAIKAARLTRPRFVKDFDADFAPCDCVTHMALKVRALPCIEVVVIRRGWWHEIKCLNCGLSWNAKAYKVLAEGLGDTPRRILTDRQFARVQPAWP